MLRVFVVDDHPLLVSGLRATLEREQDIVVVGDAPDGLAALEAIPRLDPHVVVMDLAIPKLAGPEATERIRATCPNTKILALTAHEERSYVQMALSAGASGFLLKRSAADALAQALRAIAGGGVYLDPSMAGQFELADGRASAIADLSERETEVLRLIAQGHAMKEIASSLEVSTRTLETYRTRAMTKLGLQSRVDIVRYAVRRGWLKSG